MNTSYKPPGKSSSKSPNKGGDGRRIQRVEREVQEVISRFLMGAFKGDLPGIVTITHIKMPTDLRGARVSVAVLNGTTEQNREAAEILQLRAFEIQRYVASQLTMRFTPVIKFEPDDSMEKILKVDRILHELSKNPNHIAPDAPEYDEKDDE